LRNFGFFLKKTKLVFSPDIFKNKIAFVTGGGSGIGKAIAKHFLQYGATVFIASRKEERIKAAQIELSDYGTCYAITLDIRQPEEIAKQPPTSKKRLGV
jgi:NADP-dependent 3-hydroxy acid dehydrogenase YdfG